MNASIILNGVGMVLILLSIYLLLMGRSKLFSTGSKMILANILALMLFIKIARVLQMTGFLGEESHVAIYFEILIPLLWALFLFSGKCEVIKRDLADKIRMKDLALEGANLGLWTLNIATGEATFDKRWLEILEYDRSDLEPVIGTWDRLMDPDDKDRVDAVMRDHLEGRTDFFEVEQRLLTKSGEWKWVLDKGRIIERDSFGKPQLMAGTILDISGIKMLDERCSSIENIYKTLFEHSGIAVVIIEKDTTISMANQRFAELAGMSRDAIEGKKSWREFVDPEDLEYMMKYHLARRSNPEGAPEQYEFTFIDNSRRKHNVLINIGMIEGGDKSIASLLDVSSLRRSEEKRIEMEREVRYAQRLESLGVMAAGIAHDFNNILMVIMGNADLIQSDMSPSHPNYDKTLDIIAASKRAADICKQMLAYAGEQHLVINEVDITAEIKKASRMLEVSIAKNAVLKYQLADNMPPVSADTMQLRQVILNLVINASEAVERDSGYITVATGTMHCSSLELRKSYFNNNLVEGDYAYIKVSDNGIGMDERTKTHIFDPFYTTKFPGRGLGMSTVLGVVRAHQGTIKVESQTGEGSTITVLLPIAEKSKESSEPITRQKKLSLSMDGKVLLVDDEEGVLQVAKSMLESFGLEVMTARNGKEAIDIFLRHRENIGCIIMDLAMPHMNGERAAARIRDIDRNIPILIASGYDRNKMSKTFEYVDISGFIGKPFQRSALHRELSKALKPK